MGKKPKKQKQNQPKKRRGPKAALEGSGLYLRTDSSRYWWRGVDQSTGKLIRQSTGCANLVDALLKAKKIKEELK